MHHLPGRAGSTGDHRQFLNEKHAYLLLNNFVAMVWLLNGLYCKVLNMVPRHQQIVGTILGESHARMFTLLIGIAETAMAAWILLRIQTRLNAFMQMVLVATMNLLEFFLVPDLLLWGRANAVFAAGFILLIAFNEFYLHPKSQS